MQSRLNVNTMSIPYEPNKTTVFVTNIVKSGHLHKGKKHISLMAYVQGSTVARDAVPIHSLRITTSIHVHTRSTFGLTNSCNLSTTLLPSKFHNTSATNRQLWQGWLDDRSGLCDRGPLCSSGQNINTKHSKHKGKNILNINDNGEIYTTFTLSWLFITHSSVEFAVCEGWTC